MVIMMADNLEFSDLGCYGSEIKTPHLDELARQGLRFSQFYNTEKCHSSRVSLLTGQHCIAAGDTAMTGKFRLQVSRYCLSCCCHPSTGPGLPPTCTAFADDGERAIASNIPRGITSANALRDRNRNWFVLGQDLIRDC
jgi:arylsulfatase A-like enzyme